jgi:hypothetical protein
MGRPSKLTEAQWDEIRRRLLEGEKAADLAREYGVSKTRISENVSKRASAVKDVAKQIVKAESDFRKLSVSEQFDTVSILRNLTNTFGHLSSAAAYNAATAHRLAGIAHMKVAEIDDAAPLTEESLGALKGIAVLTRMANEASEIGMNLVRANKEVFAVSDDPPGLNDPNPDV